MEEEEKGEEDGEDDETNDECRDERRRIIRLLTRILVSGRHNRRRAKVLGAVSGDGGGREVRGVVRACEVRDVQGLCERSRSLAEFYLIYWSI